MSSLPSAGPEERPHRPLVWLHLSSGLAAHVVQCDSSLSGLFDPFCPFAPKTARLFPSAPARRCPSCLMSPSCPQPKFPEPPSPCRGPWCAVMTRPLPRTLHPPPFPSTTWRQRPHSWGPAPSRVPLPLSPGLCTASPALFHHPVGAESHLPTRGPIS